MLARRGHEAHDILNNSDPAGSNLRQLVNAENAGGLDDVAHKRVTAHSVQNHFFRHLSNANPEEPMQRLAINLLRREVGPGQMSNMRRSVNAVRVRYGSDQKG